MGQAVLHVSIPKKLQYRIDDLENKKRQEAANPGVGIFTAKMAQDLKDYTKQLEDIKSGESILSTKPDTGGGILGFKNWLNFLRGSKDAGAGAGGGGSGGMPTVGAPMMPRTAAEMIAERKTPDVFRGGPPSVSSAESQAQKMAVEKARQIAMRKQAATSMAQAGVDLSGRQRDVPNPVPGRRRDASPSRSFTRTKYGKAYDQGGLVGVDYLTRRL